MMMNDFELPDSWTRQDLEDVAEIHDNLREPVNSSERAKRFGPYPYYGATGQVGWIDGYRQDGEYVLLGEDGAPFFDWTKEKSYLVSGKCWVNNHAHVLKGKEHVCSNRYLLYALNQTDYRGHANGTTRLKLTQSAMRRIPINLAPLKEQDRIVAKIEELFSELDKGVESLRTAQQQLKVYRRALMNDVLKAKSHGDSLTVPLSDLIGRINQGWSPKCELNRQASDEEWAIIKTTAVQPMQYSLEECKPLPKNFDPRPDIEIKAGDFLMTRKGPRNRTGVVCLVEATRSKSMLCDTVYRFRCDETKIYPKYLELVLNSPTVVAELDRRKSGISDSGISLNHSKLKSLPIPVIGSITTQKDVVAEVEKKLERISVMETEISHSLLKIEALRQSILKKAFSGQLVPQDPNDEPASVLLERIRAERAAQPKKHGRKAKA